MDLREKVAAMSMEERRARLAEINAMARRGDFSWNYDELCALTESIPEEKAALARAVVNSRKAALARYNRARGRTPRS
jgi:hypothetical protein